MALARRIGALDQPGPRRIHREAVPTLGGLAIAMATLGVAWLARVLVVTNAVNLIVGLDGLAAGAVAIASATLWLVARGHSDFYVMFIAALLIGSTLGFLRWNFAPARVFMGDTGSQFLGLTLS